VVAKTKLRLKPDIVSNKMRQNDHSIPAKFDEIKQNLDPSFSYLIFEKAVERENEDDFEEIVSILASFKKSIMNHDVYRDSSGRRRLLVVQLRPRQKNELVSEIVKIKLPKDIITYIYGRSPRQQGFE
jgi:hypothetical protein